jgi:hypothetical protein
MLHHCHESMPPSIMWPFDSDVVPQHDLLAACCGRINKSMTQPATAETFAVINNVWSQPWWCGRRRQPMWIQHSCQLLHGMHIVSIQPVTDASVTMRGGRFGVNIPTPVRNQLTWVRDRDDNPHFDCEETVNGITMYMYKSMTPAPPLFR